MTTYFISDLHLGHKKILEFSGDFRSGSTVEEHNDILISKINSVVNPGDHLWVLGDCVFGKHNLHLLDSINCLNKKLIMGNHDGWNIRDFLPYFVDIKGVVNYKEFLLTIYPSMMLRTSDIPDVTFTGTLTKLGFTLITKQAKQETFVSV